MSSTHSSNPVSCSAGNATIKYIENHNLVEKTQKLSEIFFKKLNSLKDKFPDHISLINGKGLIAAIIFKDDKNSRPHVLANLVCDLCLKKQLLVCKTGREAIKLGPPLVIKKINLLKGLEILEKAIEIGIKKLN